MLTRIGLRFAAVFVMAVPAAHAGAADFFINNGDVPALIAAINTANTNGEPNTIHLSAGGTYTVTVVNNNNPFEGPTGLPVINSQLVINGNGATLRRSTGGSIPAFRFFRVASAADLTINDLTMLNGDSANRGGGTIRSGAFPGLTLNNCSIRDSVTGGSGGAIFINEGNATLNNCVIHNSFANLDGGGLYNFDGHVTLNATAMSSCLTMGDGGAIYNAEGTVILTDCVITNNFSPGSGGGIYAASTTSITDSTISNNMTGPTGTGGGIRSTASITLTGTTITGNQATQGGGIHGSGSVASMTLSNCTVSDNTAAGAVISTGGGIRQDGVELIINDTIITGNNAANQGGGIDMLSNGSVASLTNCTIHDNTAGDRGGGINLGGVMLTVTDSTISDNVADDRGGGIASNGGAIIMTGATVSGNFVQPQWISQGGGIYKLQGSLTLIDSAVIDNHSPLQGGGIYFNSTGNLVVTRSRIIGNLAQEDSIGNGGGIFAMGGATVSLTDSTVSGNTALSVAGSQGAGGGALFIGGSVNMTNSTISGNTSVWGGGLRNNDVSIALTNSTIAGNTGHINTGGGIFTTAGDNSVVTLTNSIVAGNTLPPGFPGATGDIVGDWTDNGFNIVEDGVGVSHPTSMSGDPLLAPLADNGGSTMTHALLPGSIALDAGDCAGGTVTHDQRGEVRPQGGGCDIGAFEFAAETCTGDLNGDNVVDGSDLLVLLSTWGRCADPENCPADLSGDSVVDGSDLLILLSNWGTCP